MMQSKVLLAAAVAVAGVMFAAPAATTAMPLMPAGSQVPIVAKELSGVEQVARRKYRNNRYAYRHRWNGRRWAYNRRHYRNRYYAYRPYYRYRPYAYGYRAYPYACGNYGYGYGYGYGGGYPCYNPYWSPGIGFGIIIH